MIDRSPSFPAGLVSQRSLQEDFRDPPIGFRPVPLWSWNERIEPGEVRRQADLLAAAGLGGGFIHVRVGLTTGYMGDEWWAAVDAAVEQSRARGLKVWFYDEDRWPSGYAGGRVPLANPEYRMKGLLARPAGAPAPADCTPIGQPAEGIQVYAWTAPLGNDWFHGTCYGDLLSSDAMAAFLKDAYGSYHARYGALYGSDVLAEFTDEPNCMHRSRIPKGLLPHTKGLAARFQEMHGYDPIPRLPLLFVDGPEAAPFRLHYFRTVNDLFENHFSKQLGDWCREHGIAFTGHYMAEHTLFEQQLWGVKVMGNYRHQGIPGIDHLRLQVSETVTAKQCQSVVNQYGKPRMLSELYGVAGGSLTFADRWWVASQQMCLGVNLLCPHLLLYTMAGSRKRDYPQNMFYQQPWWPLNKVIDEPLSRMCVALSRGKYRAEALIVHPQESTFVHWRTRAEPHPTDQGEKLKWEFHPVTPEVFPAIDKLNTQLAAITAALFGAQRTFDFGDETILAEDASVDRAGPTAALRVGEMSYPVVILPTMTTIAATTLALLRQFQAAGGTLLLCGEPPKLLDGVPSAELDGWSRQVASVSPAELPHAVSATVPPAVSVTGLSAEEASKLYVHLRDVEDGDRLVFLTNLHRQREFVSAVRLSGGFASVYRLDPFTGNERPLPIRADGNLLELQLPFAEGESHLLRLTRQPLRPGSKPEALRPSIRETWEIPAVEWSVRRVDDNALTLDTVLWREGNAPWSTRPVPVIAVQQRLNDLKYDGPLTLRYAFQVAGLAAGRKVHVVIEHPERYDVRVNGTPVTYAGLPHYRDIRWLPIDITGLVQPGENTVELSCDFRHGDLTNVHDPFGRYGTEIEAIYLVGDFSVAGEITGESPLGEGWKRFGLHPPALTSYRAGSFSLREPDPILHLGDSVSQGLPFYAGRLELTAQLPQIPDPGAGRLFLQLARLDCPVASVAIDGQTCGHFSVAPLEVDITAAVRAGGKKLTLTLFSTLRNLMGAHHHPSGENPEEHPNTFEPVYPADVNRTEWILCWATAQSTPDGWRNNYATVSFGALHQVSVIQR